MEEQREKNMASDMETRIVLGFFRDICQYCGPRFLLPLWSRVPQIELKISSCTYTGSSLQASMFISFHLTSLNQVTKPLSPKP